MDDFFHEGIFLTDFAGPTRAYPLVREGGTVKAGTKSTREKSHPYRSTAPRVVSFRHRFFEVFSRNRKGRPLLSEAIFGTSFALRWAQL